MTTLRQIFLAIASAAIERQNADGSMPSGHNGPHRDPETPIRNTAHFVIIFTRAGELSGDPSYLQSAERCLNYLLDNNPYRREFNFRHRSNPNKDECNGLIGPAWTIEALLHAHKELNRSDALDLASELFWLHPFDEDKGIWQRVEPDGRVLSVDATFNHQLWFAACSSQMCAGSVEIKNRIHHFLEMLKSNWAIANNGRIIHPLWLPKRRLREVLKRQIKKPYRENCIAREVGYHAFNLYAFAMLKESGIEFPPHVDKKLKRALDYLDTREFLNVIEGNAYSFSYNPPGWELPYALVTLKGVSANECKNWIIRQLLHSYDKEERMMSLRNQDPNTHTARIYEAARMSDELFDSKLESPSQ